MWLISIFQYPANKGIYVFFQNCVLPGSESLYTVSWAFSNGLTCTRIRLCPLEHKIGSISFFLFFFFSGIKTTAFSPHFLLPFFLPSLSFHDAAKPTPLLHKSHCLFKRTRFSRNSTFSPTCGHKKMFQKTISGQVLLCPNMCVLLHLIKLFHPTRKAPFFAMYRTHILHKLSAGKWLSISLALSLRRRNPPSKVLSMQLELATQRKRKKEREAHSPRVSGAHTADEIA